MSVAPFAVGPIALGAMGECALLARVSQRTGALTGARVCGFHDHTNEEDPKWKWRIVVP